MHRKLLEEEVSILKVGRGGVLETRRGINFLQVKCARKRLIVPIVSSCANRYFWNHCLREGYATGAEVHAHI